jgi:hypothetical protein
MKKKKKNKEAIKPQIFKTAGSPVLSGSDRFDTSGFRSDRLVRSGF